MGQMGQQTLALGKDESVVLRLCLGVYATIVRSAVLRPEEIRSDLGD